MNRASASLAILAAAAFVLSGLLFAFKSYPLAEVSSFDSLAVSVQMQMIMPIETVSHAARSGSHLDLAIRMLRPGETVLWLLLLVVWGALLIHAGRLALNQIRTERAAAFDGREDAVFLDRAQAGPHHPRQIAATHRGDHALAELAPLSVALLAGALWPWITQAHAGIAAAVAAIMMQAALVAVVRGQRDGGSIRQSAAVGLFAGWATVAAHAAFASFMVQGIGVETAAAGVAAMLLCAVTGVFVQLRIGGSTSYSIGMIWALTGIAIVTINTEPMIAMSAVLGIAGMAWVLVRAAT